MRLGAMNIRSGGDPEAWIRSLAKEGYRTSVCPVDLDAGEDVIRSHAKAAEKAGIVIAEVGGWGNVLADSNRGTRAECLARAKRALYVADEIGANCAVNISGSRGPIWDAADERNLTAETWELVVASVREIIDEVRPKRTFYTLEPMPWMYPCDIETQRRLIRDIDRRAFAVHFDPVNLIRTVELYFGNAAFVRDFIREFGSLIKCVHAKDTLLDTKLTMQLREVRAGQGRLDYRTLLTELQRLDPEMPVLVEHLKTDEEYAEGVRYIREIARDVGVPV